MREADAVPAELQQIQLRSPGGREPHVDVVDAGRLPGLLVNRRQPAPDLGHELTVAQVVKLDFQRVELEPDAGKRGYVLDGGLALGAAERDIFPQVARDDRALPGLEKAQPQLRPVDAARVHDAVLTCRRRLEQALDLELAGDLQVDRRLDDLRGLDDPGQPALVLAGGAAGDVDQGGLVAQRLESEHRGVSGAERVVRAGRDDQRQVLLVRPPDGRADDVVPLRLGDEGLLQPVREHDDLPVLEQAPPDRLAFRGGDEAGIHLAQEPVPRQNLEVEVGGRVTQPDRNGNGALLGQ